MKTREKASARAKLRATFEEFTRAARSLEAAYDALRERSRAIDRALAETNARLASVLDSMPSGVVATDSSGRIATFNRAARTILGTALDGAEGRRPEDLLDDGGRPVLAIGRGRADGLERTLTVAGREITVTSRVVPLRGAGRAALGSLEILDDVTEVRALTERVRSLDRLAFLGEVAASIAHQVRNPLLGVVGFGGLLRRSLADRLPGTDPARRFLDRLLDGVKKADAVVTGTLALARRGPLAIAPVRAADLLAETLEEALSDLPDERRRAIAIEAPRPGTGPTALADRSQMKQALLNLVRNAIEAMTPAGGTLRAEARRAGDKVVIRLADSGPGVPLEVRARLFEPFVTGRAGGTGLGLAFARMVVDLHGGAIALEPRAPGASFRVELEAAPAPGGRTAGRSGRPRARKAAAS